jgi:hypothetical protein
LWLAPLTCCFESKHPFSGERQASVLARSSARIARKVEVDEGK